MQSRGIAAQILSVTVLVLVAFVAVAPQGGLAQARQGARLRLSSDLACLSEGGAEITFVIANRGREAVVLDGDFHLFLEKVTAGGREPAGAAFVFPIPELQTIEPGGASTFRVPIGDAGEGEPGTDLSGRRLILEAEVFLEGQERPVRRLFTFPGCNAG